MTSSRPYLVRAIYEWLVDNQLTPYVMVDAMVPQVEVPENYIEDGKIILNVAPMAVRDLSITNTDIQFDARFSGVTYHIYIPTPSIMAIYAFENGRGMVFSDEDEGDGDAGPVAPGQPPRARGKPNLKIVK